MNALELADKLQGAAPTFYGATCGLLWDAGVLIRKMHAESERMKVPDGHVVVPVEPTINMAERGSIASDYDLSQDRCRKVWAAMVHAARKEEK
jgi:hypothetical protein